MPELQYKRLHGDQIRPWLDSIAALRIRVFREWPYLYEGDLGYERDYLQTYVDSDASLAFVVLDGAEAVGVTTALPMSDEEAAFRRPLEAAGFDAAQVFYFGESILLPGYRGRGLGHRFFDEREAWAEQLGGFGHCCFCAVQRPGTHPARPAGYRPLDAFWRKRGYEKRPDIVAHYPWRDIGDDRETDKPLVFWLRRSPDRGRMPSSK